MTREKRSLPQAPMTDVVRATPAEELLDPICICLDSSPTCRTVCYALGLIMPYLVVVVLLLSFICYFGFVCFYVIPFQPSLLSVSSAVVSSFDLSPTDAKLSADFDIALSVRSPDKKLRNYYDRARAAVLYFDTTIAEGPVPSSFLQGDKNMTTMAVRVAAVGEPLKPAVANSILGQRQVAGTLTFNVKLSARAARNTHWMNFFGQQVTVYCDDVTVSFANGSTVNGSMLGPSTGCHNDMS